MEGMQAVADFFRVICRNKRSFSGMIILLVFILMATVGTHIFKLDMTIDFNGRYQAPSWHHLLGTDFGGRDTFIQLVYGSKEVLTVAFFSAVFTLVIGAVLGMLSGLVGGRLDAILMVITNVFLTIPHLPIYIILAALFSIRSPYAFAAILSLFSWAALTRAVRSQIISLKERDFIVICRVMGRSRFAIIFKELLPNITSYLAINFIFNMRGAIGASVGVMMLGLVPYSPTNWGQMLTLAISQTGGIFNPLGYIYITAPILCLGLMQLGSIFFANGLDEALNPRLRR